MEKNPRKKRRRKGSSSSSSVQSKPKEDDRLSNLPHEILLHILSLLDNTKQAVQTSVLSTRWRRLWIYLQDFHFESSYFSDPSANFDNFVRTVLLHRDKKSQVGRFRLYIGIDCSFDGDENGLALRNWAIIYAARHGVRDLIIHHDNCKEPLSLPQELVECDTLKTLELNFVHLPPESFRFATIRDLHLEECEFDGGLDVLAACPNLTNLSLIRPYLGRDPVVKICGSKLVNLTMEGVRCDKVEISAQNLVYFKYVDEDIYFNHMLYLLDFSVIHLPSLQQAEVYVTEPDRHDVEEFQLFYGRFFKLLRGIHNAAFLKINTHPLEVLNAAGLLEYHTSPFSKLKRLTLDLVHAGNRGNGLLTVPANVMTYLLSGTPYSHNVDVVFQYMMA